MKLSSGTSIRLLFSLAALLILANTGRLHAQTNAPFALTRFTVVDQGTAGKPDVVLIPGLSSSRRVWDAEAVKLGPNYRLHLVQINGFAGQPADANAGDANLIPALVVELDRYIATRHMRPVVIGHSLGGLLALLLAEQHPADVRKLIIVDTLPFYATMFAADATVEGARPVAAQMKQQIASLPDDRYNAMQPTMAAQMAYDAAAQKLIAAWSSSSDRGVVAEAMSEDLMTDARPGLSQMKTPALVLFERDAMSAQAAADTFEKLMRAEWSPAPNATLMLIDKSKHFIMYDQPEKFDAAIEPFLK